MRTVRVYRWPGENFSEPSAELFDPERLYQEKIVDEAGREIEAIYYREEGDFDFREANLYDENGRLVRAELFNSEKGAADETTIFHYNEQGHVVTEEHFFMDELFSVTRNRYDSSGNLLEMVLKEGTEEIRKERFTYAFKDCISLHETWENGVLTRIVKYTWSGTSESPVLEEEFLSTPVNPDLDQKTIYSVPCEENGWVSATIYEREDIVEVIRETRKKDGALLVTQHFDGNASLLKEYATETDAEGRVLFWQHTEGKSGSYSRNQYNDNGDLLLNVSTDLDGFTTCVYEYL